jgi:hypothetical protein
MMHQFLAHLINLTHTLKKVPVKLVLTSLDQIKQAQLHLRHLFKLFSLKGVQHFTITLMPNKLAIMLHLVTEIIFHNLILLIVWLQSQFGLSQNLSLIVEI